MPIPAGTEVDAHANYGAVAALRQMVEAAQSQIRTLVEIQEAHPSDGRVLEMLGVLSQLLRNPPPPTMSEVEALVDGISWYSSAPDRERPARGYELNQVIFDVVDKRRESLATLRSPDARSLVETAERIQILDRADKAALQVESTAERIEQVETHVRDLAGNASATSLAMHYETQAADEERSANRLRSWAITLTVVAAGAVIFIPIDDLPASETFHRLAFSVPALLLSGYLAREAAQHRYVSRELRSAEVKLKSLWGFAEGLPDSEIRTAFLERVGSALFSLPTAQPGEDRQPVATLDQMDILLQRLVDLLRTQRGS